MPERKKERSRRKIDNPTEPQTQDTKTGKQTKFVLDMGDLEVSPEQLENLRSSILKNSIALIQSGNIKSSKGDDIRPKIGVEEFSVSFSAGFSLGA